MIFYSGDAFPRWHNNIFIGSLTLRYLERLVVEGEHVIHEERLLSDRAWKIRAAQQAPDGSLYIGVDGGWLARITPVAQYTRLRSVPRSARGTAPYLCPGAR
jgi:aldose sugar dehydrogenase